MPIHRDCQRSKADSRECKILYIGRDMKRKSRNSPVYVNGDSNHRDLATFRAPSHSRFQNATKLYYECLRLTFDGAQARNSFAGHLIYHLTLREEMMDQRRLDVDSESARRTITWRRKFSATDRLVPVNYYSRIAHHDLQLAFPETRIESTAPAIGALGFEESFASLAFEGKHVPRRDEAASTMRHGTSISTMSTMSIPAPPYSLFEDPQSPGSHYG
jgi:hypothetical protein